MLDKFKTPSKGNITAILGTKGVVRQSGLVPMSVVFVVDTTSSMASFIQDARQNIALCAREVAGMGVQPSIGMVQYRDHPPMDRVLVEEFLPTSHITRFQAYLGQVEVDGGGDVPEAVLDGVERGVRILSRCPEPRLLWVVGDAPGHGWAREGDHWPQGCPCGMTVETVAQAAKDAGVRVECLCLKDDRDAERFFKALAAAAGGGYHHDVKALTAIREVVQPLMLKAAKALIAGQIRALGGS